MQTEWGVGMELPKRKRARLSGYDYAQNGAYFITICTHNRENVLSEIRRGGAERSPIGKICDEEINNIPAQFGARVDTYVIMPNHVHLIITIDRTEDSPGGAEPRPYNSLAIPDIVCAMKSRTTKRANKEDNQPGRKIWQRSYHDHIIRNEQDNLKIWQYIDENPLKWEVDCFYRQ